MSLGWRNFEVFQPLWLVLKNYNFSPSRRKTEALWSFVASLKIHCHIRVLLYFVYDKEIIWWISLRKHPDQFNPLNPLSYLVATLDIDILWRWKSVRWLKLILWHFCLFRLKGSPSYLESLLNKYLVRDFFNLRAWCPSILLNRQPLKNWMNMVQYWF